jgi:hypothetical protein
MVVLMLFVLCAATLLPQVPLYSAGDDPNAKQFRSLHAVQRHMVDTNQCRWVAGFVLSTQPPAKV